MRATYAAPVDFRLGSGYYPSFFSSSGVYFILNAFPPFCFFIHLSIGFFFAVLLLLAGGSTVANSTFRASTPALSLYFCVIFSNVG